MGSEDSSLEQKLHIQYSTFFIAKKGVYIQKYVNTMDIDYKCTYKNCQFLQKNTTEITGMNTGIYRYRKIVQERTIHLEILYNSMPYFVTKVQSLNIQFNLFRPPLPLVFDRRSGNTCCSCCSSGAVSEGMPLCLT